MSHILAIDIGTSSLRAALYDFEGNVIPETLVKNERVLAATDDGGAEIDAEEAFQQVVSIIDDVLEKSKNVSGKIEYVAACAFWHSLVGVDGRGEPTTKVFGWADTRSREFVKVLRAEFDEDETHKRTGARFHSSYWTAKLLWLRAEFPETFTKTAKWLSFSDFVGMRLCGEVSYRLVGRRFLGGSGHLMTSKEFVEPDGNCLTSVSMASATGIFDIRKKLWDEELINSLNIKLESLPEIVEEDSETFRLNEIYRERWKKLKMAKWFPAIGDGAANNIGAACVTKSKATLMIGTSGAMRVAFKGEPPAKIPQGLWCYRIDRKRVIIGGALSDGGGLYAWLKNNLKLRKTDEEIESEISKRTPDEHGLAFLPFLAGERSTGYNESAHGVILGLKFSTDSFDIVQCALESVAYRFAEIYNRLNEVLSVKEIIASGGALRASPVWTQIIADVLGRNLLLPDTDEASSRGAVLLALETIGKIESIEKTDTPKDRKFKFDKKRNAIYRKARKRHNKLYNLIINNENL